MWLDQDNLAWALLLAGLALLCWVLLRRAARRRRVEPRLARTHDEPAKSQDGRGLKDAPPEVVRWSVALHETARDLKAELDSKISVLRAVIRLAEQERRALEETIRRARAERGGSEPPERAEGR